MIDGYRAYRFYLATKLHFTTEKYDVFHAQGAVKYTKSQFEARNDKYIFSKLGQRLSSERDFIQYIASNFIYGNPDVIYSGSEADENYLEWQRRKQSQTKLLADDCYTIIELGKTDPELFNCTNNQIPIIITLLITKKINIETVRILDDHLQFVDKWDGTVLTMFGDLIRTIKKAKGFIKYDKTKVRPIINNLIEQTMVYDGQHIPKTNT